MVAAVGCCDAAFDSQMSAHRLPRRWQDRSDQPTQRYSSHAASAAHGCRYPQIRPPPSPRLRRSTSRLRRRVYFCRGLFAQVLALLARQEWHGSFARQPVARDPRARVCQATGAATRGHPGTSASTVQGRSLSVLCYAAVCMLTCRRAAVCTAALLPLHRRTSCWYRAQSQSVEVCRVADSSTNVCGPKATSISV